MRHQLTALVDNIMTLLLLAAAFVTPLAFAPLATEYFEMPKLFFLVALALILLALWTFKWVLAGKVSFVRTPLDIAFVLVFLVVVFSTVFSSNQNISIYGNFPRAHGSAVSWIAYILLFFMAVSHLKTRKLAQSLLLSLLTSSVIVVVISLLSYFNVFVFGQVFDFSKVVNFSPAGGTFSTTALALLFLPLALILIVRPNKLLPLPVALVVATLFSVFIALTANTGLYIVALILVVLVYYASKSFAHFSVKESVKGNLLLLFIPVVIGALLALASFIPIPGGNNILQQKRINFPTEVQLPFNISWKVSASAFRDAPFLGSGPSTYLFDFTQYKPVEFNSGRFWNVRFDSAYNEFLQMLATTGGLGLLSLVFLSVLVLTFAWKGLLNSEDPLTAALSVSAVVAILLLAVHTSTVVSLIASVLILALLLAINKSASKAEEISLGIKASKITDSNLIAGDILPVFVFIPVLIFSVIGIFQLYNIVLADYYHRLALNNASTRGVDTYNYLVKAETLNPRVDLYRIDLAQTNFALANAIAAQKGPSESSPGGSLTDQDKQNIQKLLSQSIDEARVAVALSPQNPQNWEILASIYRQISGVAQNALAFSLDAYGKAIQRDPLNPLLRLSVGGVYYSVRNYDLAIRFFTDAVNLKPDFANGYYNLSVALRDKGDLQGAQAAAEQTVKILQENTNNPDYKLASDYLSDLKARIATASAQQTKLPPLTPPAARETGALQNKELPKVLDEELKNAPDKIATPPAVKR